MAFIDAKERVMIITLTQLGRRKLSEGKLNIKYYTLNDDEVDYQAQYVNQSGSV